jgi:hypothetical protein
VCLSVNECDYAKKEKCVRRCLCVSVSLCGYVNGEGVCVHLWVSVSEFMNGEIYISVSVYVMGRHDYLNITVFLSVRVDLLTMCLWGDVCRSVKVCMCGLCVHEYGDVCVYVNGGNVTVSMKVCSRKCVYTCTCAPMCVHIYVCECGDVYTGACEWEDTRTRVYL